MRAHQQAICSSSWWSNPMRVHGCSCGKSSPRIEAAQIPETDNFVPANDSERNVSAVMIGWRNRRNDRLEFQEKSDLSDKEWVLCVCRFRLQAWLGDPPCAAFLLFLCLNRNLPVTTSTLPETGTPARGTGTPYSRGLTRNEHNLSGFNSGETTWIYHRVRNDLWCTYLDEFKPVMKHRVRRWRHTAMCEYRGLHNHNTKPLCAIKFSYSLPSKKRNKGFSDLLGLGTPYRGEPPQLFHRLNICSKHFNY